MEANNGKQFPVTGKATAAYHVPGTELLGTNQIVSNEKTINVDYPLIADAFIANIDEAISHFDVKSIYTQQLARALAIKADKQLLQVSVLTARASANATGLFGGTTLVDPTLATDGEALYNALFDAAQALDEKDVPAEDRFVVLKPAQFKLLARYTKIHDERWGGTGTIADGDVGKLAGISVLKSNHVPQTNITADTGANNTYNADFSNTVGVVFQREAIGTLKLRDLAMETMYQPNRQGTLMLAKYIMGHGALRPECAVELAKA